MRSLMILVVLSLAGARTFADELYYLKFEESGYDALVRAGESPRGELVRSVEFLVRPDEPFSIQTKAGNKAFSMVGMLRATGDTFSLRWSHDPTKKLAKADQAPSDPRVLDLQNKLAKLQERIVELRELLAEQRAAAKEPDTDAAVQRTVRQLGQLQLVNEQLKREIWDSPADDGVAETSLKLGEPKKVSSIAGDTALSDGMRRMFERVTTVTLRNRLGGRSPDETADNRNRRTVWIRPVNSDGHNADDKGMMLDAIEHNLRIEKALRDERNVPTTFEPARRNRFDFFPPLLPSADK